ncbi:MAG: hypothetical protein P8Z35_08425 [Ignavibacteriaceae bacterium]
MIDKKYIELINKEIDKEITPKEKAILHEYLSSDSEAKNLYNELFASENLLDTLPDNDPSVNLKKQILNSIDKDRYSRVKKDSTFSKFIHQTLFQTKYKIAFTFTLGLLAGLLIYSLLFNNQATENNNIYGTIGINSEVIKSIPVEASNIGGKLDIKWINNNLGLDFSLSSPEQYNLALKFNPDKTKFDNISFYGKNKIKLDSEEDMLKISESGNHNYLLLFSLKAEMTVNFNLQISRGGNLIFEKQIVVINK